MKTGDKVQARITKIMDFGAFAEFGTAQGLIYFTQVDPHVEHGKVDSVLSIGQTVECQIKEIKADGKINLTMKAGSSQPQQRRKREELLQEVRKDINDMSLNDTSIRTIWKKLTDIQHYLLKYMQGAITLKQNTIKIDSKADRLIAEIDTSIHFEDFKSEVRRVFSADLIEHPVLKGYWFFETDVELHTLQQRKSFAENSGHMYVVMQDSPVLEIYIKDFTEDSKVVILKRLQGYYPHIEVLHSDNENLILSLPYSSRSDLNDLKIELGYALNGIRNGIPDEVNEDDYDEDIEVQENETYDAVNFNFETRNVKDGCDRFLISLNSEALMDQEGLRFGSFKGQNFVIPQENGDVTLGILHKIEYPYVTFKLNLDSKASVIQLFHDNCILKVLPDIEDMRGEIEKINRLRDSFDRITEHPEDLPNPKLSSYLFDASKATPIEEEQIANRIELIKQVQLNDKLNDSQVSAIAKAVEALDLALIQGPPGTGKSTAIAELIWQLVIKANIEALERQQQQPKCKKQTNQPNIKILITSEANLAVDNALDKLKSSIHNIVKPIRIAAGDKFSSEGLAYSVTEMKKWAGIELTDIEIEDDEAIRDLIEFRSFNPNNVVLNQWMLNIFKRSLNRGELSEGLSKKWFDIITDLPQPLRKTIYNQYRLNCNVIGATCSAITDKNYAASEQWGNYVPSRFIKKFWSIYQLSADSPKTKLRFDVVIQDEASKATPAELSLPLSYGKKAVVIGDHRQLPPNLDKEDILFKLHMQRLRSSSQEEHEQILALEKYVKRNFDILEKSHFERLFRQISPMLKGTFDTQYRMHQDINDVIYQFYVEENGLRCGIPSDQRQHDIDIPNFISPNNHVIWVNTSSPEVRDGTSRANRGETEAISWVLSQLQGSDSFNEYQERFNSDEDKEIGLITFYGSQMKRLRPIVDRATNNGLRIKMSSVDRFQGMERNIIIVSLVRSNLIAQTWNAKPNFRSYPERGFAPQTELGFAKSPNRLNVALSRAKRLLIIVGNAEHFSSFVNPSGQAIYRNVYETIQANPNGRIIDWSSTAPVKEPKHRIRRIPMPKNRSVNLNTRDINIDSDKNLRIIETWFTPNGQPIEDPHFAVLELSTKAVKLLFAHDEHAVLNSIMTSNRFIFDNFNRDGRKPETGKGLDEQNVMNMIFFRSQVLPVIKSMVKTMKRERIDVVYTIATAAYRTAKNRDEVIQCIREEAGINVRILSKKEESVATMYAYGITSRYKAELQQSQHTIMIDQGGGSTEVSVFNQGELIGSYSINLGTTALRNMLTKDVTRETTMREALRKSDQMLKERMVAFMKNMSSAMFSETESFCVSVGTAITSATGKKGNSSQHDTILDYDMLKQKIDKLSEFILQEFSTVGELMDWEQSLSNGTIDKNLTMRMGLPMYLIIMEKFNVKSIHVCGTGLWYGIYLQHLFNTTL